MQSTSNLTDKFNKSNLTQIDYVSCDAPPLDFSFKNLVSLEEIKNLEPRQGQKKKVQVQSIQHQKTEHQQVNEEEALKQKRKPQVIKLLPQNNINSVVSSLVNTSAMKNISTKAKQELEKQKKKSVNVKLVCCSIMLGYNKIRQIQDFCPIMKSVMDNWQSLQWIDLSHNYLQTLDYDFRDFPQLRTLYLHCNFLFSFNDITKLSHIQGLKTFTIHGNSLTSVPNFRLLTISILPQLKKLDSVLVSKKERDNSIFIRSQTKKFPQPKNIIKPPQQKKQQEEEEKE